jgi:signal peptidase I
MPVLPHSNPTAVPTLREKSAWLRRTWRLTLGGCLVLMLLVLGSYFQLVIVKGTSMQPTFRTGDLLLVYKFAYRTTEPQRADIVVARYRGDLIVKRVVGLPGEEVAVQSGSLLINGLQNLEGHGIEPGELTIEKGKLLNGKFALLGDNRAFSVAEQIHAVVAKSDMVGKVIYSFCLRWPGSANDLSR